MSSELRRIGLLTLLAGALAACEDPKDPVPGVDTTASIDVTALTMFSARIQWAFVDGDEVLGYRVERRAGTEGSFEEVITVSQTNDPLVYVDNELEPATMYGYRVITVSRQGKESVPSVVRGVMTPPPPGIRVQTRTNLETANALDPDGYRAQVRRSLDTLFMPVAPSGAVLFSPLETGSYQVALNGLSVQCRVQGDSLHTVEVSDTGVATVDTVRYLVNCRDPSLGAIQARIRAQGDSLDADSLVVTVTGITADDSVVSRRRTTGGAGGELLFSGLPPAIYEVELSDVQGNCTVEGGTTRTAAVTPLGTDTVTYAVNCEGSAQEERPFKVRSRWSPNPAPTGQRVELEMSLDMGADPSLIVCLVEGAIKFDDAILRFDAARPGDLSDFFAVGNPAAGLIALSAISASGTSGASIVAARLDFTVLGAEGAKTRPSVNDLLIAGGSDCGTQLDTLFNVVTDTLVVGTGPGNTPPTANAGGPYSGFVGTPIAFDGSGSSDPEDNIVAWAWEFGDGATGSGATASHTYSADGNFTARLTVTDALGESDSDETSVQVALPGNAPPVAEAGGPYSGRVGEPVAFDGSGSTDPDGSVVSWDWDFGDAETGSGAVLDHTYDQPGSYTATLTVADNEGDTDSDAASVVISDTTTATDSVVYTARFGTVDPGSGTVALTLSIALPQDIPQSAGDEAIDRWTIAPLAWDPAVLAYQSAQFAPGGAGSVSAGTGQLTIRGFQPPSNNTGNITLITVRFQVVGSSGTLTTTTTTFTELLRTSAPGEFDYLPYLVIREGTLVVP